MSPIINTLTRYIPTYVARQLAANPALRHEPSAERFEAAVLFVDISGFTALTEQLAQRGPAGVEELSQLLKTFFTELTNLIFAHGGDVMKFAGDALLALWPGAVRETTRRATQCALAIQAALHNYPVAGHTLRMRIGVGTGTMSAVYVGGAYGRWEFVLNGAPLAQVGEAEAQAQPGEVLLSPEAWQMVSTYCVGETLATHAGRVRGLITALDPLALAPIELPDETEAALWAHIPGAIRARLAAAQTDWLAELRRVTVLFLNLPDLDHNTPLDQAQRTMLALQTALYRYEGSVNKISIDEKGSTLVAALGMPPLAHEDDAARGLRAAQAMLAALHELGVRAAIGVTTGRVFCGTVGSDRRCEYTLLGDSVNLAARLMQAALRHPTAPLLCDSATAEAAQQHFTFTALPPITVKGKADPIAIFQPEAETRSAPRSKAEMVGRVAEQMQIATHLQALLTGASCALIISGEAGIGKSQLVEGLVRQAQALGIGHLLSTADAVEKASPYHAWRGVFAQLFGLDVLNENPEQHRTRVMAYLTRFLPDKLDHAPLLNPVLPLDFPETEFSAHLTNEGRASFTRDLLIVLLREIAHANRLVLILEDAHWLDSSSWAMVGTVVREIHPLLFVLVLRPLTEPVPREYQQLHALPTTHTLALTALAPAEITQLLTRRLGVAAMPTAVLNLIQTKAEGHPFFSEELAYSLRDAGLLVIADGECRVAPGVNLQTVNFPDTVQGVITSRIDRLTPQQQLALKVASVIGRVFAYRTLHAVYPIEADKPHLSEDLTALERLDLTPLETPPPELEYIFKHIITQEVAYNLMTFVQRRQLHGAVVNWYERVFAEDIAPFYPLLAQHWIQVIGGTQTDDEVKPAWMIKAMDYVEKAAAQALQNSAHPEAVLLLNHLLSWQQRPGWLAVPDTRRAQWEIMLGEAHFALGQSNESKVQLLRAVARLGWAEPPAARLGLGLLWEIMQQIAHLVWPPRPVAPAARLARIQATTAYSRLGQVFYYTQEGVRTLYAGCMAANLADQAGPSSVQARAIGQMCAIWRILGAEALAQAYYRKAQAITAQSPDPHDQALASEYMGVYLLSVGKWRQSQEIVENSVSLFQRVGNTRGESESVGLLTWIYMQEGQLARAHQMAAQICAAGQRWQDTQTLMWGICLQVETGLPAQFPFAQAQALLQTACDQHLSSLAISDQMRPWGLLCWIYTRLLEWEAAEQCAQKALALTAQATDIPFYSILGYGGPAEFFLTIWERQQSDPTFALRRPLSALNQHLQMLCRRMHHHAGSYPVMAPYTWRYQGWYEWLAGRPRQAQTCWQKSLTLAQNLAMPIEAGRTHYEIARHLPADAPARAEHLQQALDVFRHYGAENEAARVVAAQGQ